MARHLFGLLIITVLTLCVMGCSSGNPPTGLIPEPQKETSVESSHSLWGMWQGVIDPVEQAIEFTPLRAAEFHLNALPFLEPPPLMNLTLEHIEFNGNIITVDIGLRNPFLGLTEFSGFDVCGIFISNGSISGFSDANLIMTGDGDTRILNPDGLSRWWNPSEFPVNLGTIGSYNDGLLGAPDSFADYNTTLNGYKYYCDDLDDITDSLADVTQAGRGLFSAGQKNVRRYIIETGADGLIFNYAIDANWQFPDGAPPWTAPDDFAPEANRVEAWRVDLTEDENTLWNDGVDNGGDLSLTLDVYDWFNAEMNSVRVESPGNFTMVETAVTTGGSAGYSTYEIEITGATPAETQISLLVSVGCEEEDFGGFITGTNTTSYFTFDIAVDDEAPQQGGMKNIPLRTNVEALDVGINHSNDDCFILYDDDQIWKHTSTDGYATGTYLCTVACVNPSYDFHPLMMDVNALGVIGLGHNTPTLTVCWTWRYQVDGTYMNEGGLIGACTQRWMSDITFFGNSGTYANYQCLLPGGFWSGSSYRNWWYIWGPPNYNTHSPGVGVWCSNYTGTGLTGIDRVNVTALDTDQNGQNLWVLEGATEDHCTMWELTPPGGFPYLNYANSYIPSAADTSHWFDPVDLTRDDANRLLLLDENSGQGIISVWTGSSSGGSYIGEVGNPSTISEQPRRIDGSDFDGKVFVIHGDTFGPTDGYLMSIFLPTELP